MMNKIGNYRWWIVTLLFFATTINYIDRQIIGILKPYIEGDLGWSEVDYGYIVTAFQIAYGVGLLVTGRFIDRLGTRNGFSWAISIWSLATMFHAAARSVGGFVIARAVLGVGEAANFPAAVKTVGEWSPKKERAFANGLFNAGSNFGAILAPVIVSVLYIAFGWMWAFIITGSLGFAGAVGGAVSATLIGFLLEATGSYFLIFLIASGVYIVNWLIIKLLIKEIKPLEI